MSERTFGPKRTPESGERPKRRFLGEKEDVRAYFERKKEVAKKMGAAALGTPVGAGVAGGVKAVETLGWGIQQMLRLNSFDEHGISSNKTAEESAIKGYKWTRGGSKS